MTVRTIKIEYDIKLKSPFHIGSGYSRGLIDRTAVKDRRDLLYIPGSVIKGNVRNIAEDYAKNFNMTVCNPHNERSALQCFGFNPCIACRIFGSRQRTGGLIFENAILLPEYEELYNEATDLQNQERTRVRISRRLNHAQQGALFTTEYGTASPVFRSAITGFLIDTTPITAVISNLSYEVLLLLIALKSLKRIGGDRSVGTGWIDVDIDPNNPKQEDKTITYNGKTIKLIDCFSSDHLESMEFAADEREGVLR